MDHLRVELNAIDAPLGGLESGHRRCRGGGEGVEADGDDGGRDYVRGEIHPRNRLNALSGNEWLYFTKSVWTTAYPSELGHALRKQHGANKPPRLMARLIEFFTKSGELVLDPSRHQCTWKGKEVHLTVTEFLILQALAIRPGVVKSRNALMDAAYDDQVYVDDRTIDSHIKRLRKKFNQVDVDFDMIETLYGVGYRFKEL